MAYRAEASALGFRPPLPKNEDPAAQEPASTDPASADGAAGEPTRKGTTTPREEDDAFRHEVTDPEINALTTTLQVSPARAFELFCDLRRVPEWVSVIRSVQILGRDSSGYATRAAFLAGLERGSVGYTLRYKPRPAELTVTWESEPGGAVVVRGRAHFSSLGPEATLLHYQLQLSLPSGSLPSWGDPFFDGHAASAILSDFRDFVHRSMPLVVDESR